VGICDHSIVSTGAALEATEERAGCVDG
jgi:hypothetical protein